MKLIILIVLFSVPLMAQEESRPTPDGEQQISREQVAKIIQELQTIDLLSLTKLGGSQKITSCRGGSNDPFYYVRPRIRVCVRVLGAGVRPDATARPACN